jgi:oligoendopeptidase F
MTAYQRAEAAAGLSDDALPSWDLTDLYPAMDSPELAAELERATADAKAFAKNYQGKIAGLSGKQLAAAIAAYEQLDEHLSKAWSMPATMKTPRSGNSIRASPSG